MKRGIFRIVVRQYVAANIICWALKCSRQHKRWATICSRARADLFEARSLSATPFGGYRQVKDCPDETARLPVKKNPFRQRVQIGPARHTRDRQKQA